MLWDERRLGNVKLYLGFLCRIEALHAFADLTDDDDLAVVIVKRLDAIAEEYRQVMRWLG
jgi:hypothetical protein